MSRKRVITLKEFSTKTKMPEYLLRVYFIRERDQYASWGSDDEHPSDQRWERTKTKENYLNPDWVQIEDGFTISLESKFKIEEIFLAHRYPRAYWENTIVTSIAIVPATMNKEGREQFWYMKKRKSFRSL